LAVWPVLPYDATVPRVWGRLVADREAVGSPVAANDAWIPAACCIVAGVPLMTLNRKHFEAIRGLTLLPPMTGRRPYLGHMPSRTNGNQRVPVRSEVPPLSWSNRFRERNSVKV
jgi:hypothetical protein